MRNGSAGTGRRAGTVLLMAVALGGCATTGATVGSGVGDRMLHEPPYVAGRSAGGVREVAHLPIAFQAGSTQAPIFDPSYAPDSPVAAMLREMNGYLERRGESRGLEITAPLRGTPPDVQFGCEQLAGEDCEHRLEDPTTTGRRWMKLAVGRPSPSWIAGLAAAMDSAGADATLVLTLEVGQYWVHQRNVLGAKEVRLGTGHTVGVPWLTSLDQPVQVLQLTGALVDREGRAIRIGAEGLWARRTRLLLSAVGAQELVTDEDVERLRTARREDLPGSPLVWEVAMENLVRGLTR